MLTARQGGGAVFPGAAHPHHTGGGVQGSGPAQVLEDLCPGCSVAGGRPAGEATLRILATVTVLVGGAWQLGGGGNTAATGSI